MTPTDNMHSASHQILHSTPKLCFHLTTDEIIPVCVGGYIG